MRRAASFLLIALTATTSWGIAAGEALAAPIQVTTIFSDFVAMTPGSTLTIVHTYDDATPAAASSTSPAPVSVAQATSVSIVLAGTGTAADGTWSLTAATPDLHTWWGTSLAADYTSVFDDNAGIQTSIESDNTNDRWSLRWDHNHPSANHPAVGALPVVSSWATGTLTPESYNVNTTVTDALPSFVDSNFTVTQTVQAVPEPSSIALLALGAIGVVWRRRRVAGHAGANRAR